MLRRMLELEVPEIYNGLVDIKSVAREAGQRSKVAVSALQEGVDPVGACVGMRGVRIQSIVRELNDEKIDVIEWNSDPRIFIAKALSPARVSQVYLQPDSSSGKTATVVVADDQLSLAIGREGQNARLAAKLTGWRIDIKSLTEAATEALTKREHPLVADIFAKDGPLVEHVEIVLAKKAAERPITAEDFQTLNRFIDMVDGRFAKQVEAEQKAEENARKSVDPLFWQMPLRLLELSESVTEGMISRGFATVGHVLALLNHNPVKLQERARLDKDAFAGLQERMALTEFPQTADELELLLTGEIKSKEPELVEAEVAADEEVAAEVSDEEVVAEAELDVEPVALYEEPPEDIRLPSPEPEPEPEPKPVSVVKREKPKPKAPVIKPARQVPEDKETESQTKKGKKRRRQLVFNEEAGAVVAKRKHKRGRAPEWDQYSDE